MGWLMPRRSRSLAGSHGRRFPRRGGGGPSRVPARTVLLLLAMVAALAPRAFAQTTPNPGDRWTPGGVWNHDVTTTSLTGELMLQQSVTLSTGGGSGFWEPTGISACPWTRVTPPLPSTSCQSLRSIGDPASTGSQFTVTNFVPTQAMIDNGGVVIRLSWRNYGGTAGNVVMTEWVPLVSAPNAVLVLTPASISENGGVSTVTATLSSVSSAAVTITVSAAAGAGAVAADFSLSSATTLTIAAGSTMSAGSVTITANDNSVASGSKQVTVSATAAGGNGVAAPSSATLTITDDDAPQTTLLLSSSSIAENAGVATVTATLDRTSSAATTITVSAAAGAGAVAADFSLSSATTLTIAANATTSTGTVTITANDNDTDSPDKQVTVTATVSNSQGAGSVTGATLTLTDDEAAPGVTLTVSPASISENGGVATVTATLSHPSVAETTITVMTAPEAPAVAGDYTLSAATTLTIAANATTSTGTVTIAAVDNDVAAADKTVTVSGMAANSQGAGTVTGAPLTLTDDEAAPGVTLTLSPSSISENGGVATVTATLSHPSVAETTITVMTAPEAPAVASDYTLSAATTLTIAANATTSTGTVTITSNDNDTDSPDRTATVTATVANDQGAGSVTGATLTLTDDDAAPGVTLAVSPASISENGGVATVSATLSHPSSAATTITVSAAPGTNAVAGDYTLSAAMTVTIAARNISSSGTVTIAAVDNDVDAEDKTVTVSGTAANSQGAGTVTGASLTIRDDEKGLAFARAEDPDFDRSRVLEVTEGNPDGTGYTVALTSWPTGTVTVTVAVASANVTVNPASLTFDATDWSTARTVTVTATDDGNDYAEPASVSHTASGGGYGGVFGSLQVSVTGETAVRTDGASGTRTYFIERREVEVTVGDGVPSGIVVDFAGVGSVAPGDAPTMTISPSRAVPTAIVERAEDDGFNLGLEDPEGSRTVVDIEIVNAPGVRVCLPVNAAVVAGARDTGRLRLLRDDGSVWAPVAGAEEYDAAMARICAPGVTSFGPFATGYANTKPAFDSPQKDLVFTVDEAIDPVVTLPAAKGGDGLVTYSIKERLPDRLNFDSEKRTISGTPKAAQGKTTYTLVATDADNETAPEPWKFTIAVEHGLEKARARLKAINESVLPELSRALWGSALDAVTGRLESPDAAAPTAAGGLEAAATFARANESALEAGDVSWKELLGESFAFGLAGDGEGGPGEGGVVAWGSGDWRRLSRDEDALDWSGDAFSAHVGVDAALRADLRAGLAASRFWSDVDYTDRSGDAAVKGSHESRMTSLTPYLGWAAGDGARLWGAAGYGWGEIEIVDEDLRARFGAQKADSRFLAGAVGGSVPVWSQGPATLKAKGSAEATRWRVKDNAAAIAGVKVSTQRLRLAAEGSWAYALTGGASLTPTLETGVRWDGGDGATGTGLEAGGGLSWTDPTRGLTVEAKGRALVAHNKDVEEWGASGSMRLNPDADGFGLSFQLLPSWGASESGVTRLWDEGAAARPADGGGGNEARLETELGYGLPAFGGAGVTTPYAGFGLAQGGERDMRAGVRLGLGAGFDLGVEAERRENAADAGHGIGLDLRIRW